MDSLKLKLYMAQHRSQKFSAYSREAVEEAIEKCAEQGRLPKEIVSILAGFQDEDAQDAKEARTLYEQWCVSRAN
jgi:hypothetical protein